MKTLLVLRHAKSSWADPGMGDHDRPLNARGKRDGRHGTKLPVDRTNRSGNGQADGNPFGTAGNEAE